MIRPLLHCISRATVALGLASAQPVVALTARPRRMESTACPPDRKTFATASSPAIILDPLKFVSEVLSALVEQGFSAHEMLSSRHVN